jgi:hypothetical protein
LVGNELGDHRTRTTSHSCVHPARSGYAASAITSRARLSIPVVDNVGGVLVPGTRRPVSGYFARVAEHGLRGDETSWTDAPPVDPTWAGETIFVIEPHADDAFLSLGWSIRMWVRAGRRVEIVTVYSADEERATEAKAWATSVGAGWRGLGLTECGSIRLEQPDGTLTRLPAPHLPDDILDERDACRIWPLGLRHVEHIAVAGAAADGDLHYIDTPYQFNLFEQPAIRAALVGRVIAWWNSPPKQKWDASHFFESQRLLFDHFRPETLESLPEIVVRS